MAYPGLAEGLSRGLQLGHQVVQDKRLMDIYSRDTAIKEKAQAEKDRSLQEVILFQKDVENIFADDAKEAQSRSAGLQTIQQMYDTSKKHPSIRDVDTLATIYKNKFKVDLAPNVLSIMKKAPSDVLEPMMRQAMIYAANTPDFNAMTLQQVMTDPVRANMMMTELSKTVQASDQKAELIGQQPTPPPDQKKKLDFDMQQRIKKADKWRALAGKWAHNTKYSKHAMEMSDQEIDQAIKLQEQATGKKFDRYSNFFTTDDGKRAAFDKLTGRDVIIEGEIKPKGAQPRANKIPQRTLQLDLLNHFDNDPDFKDLPEADKKRMAFDGGAKINALLNESPELDAGNAKDQVLNEMFQQIKPGEKRTFLGLENILPLGTKGPTYPQGQRLPKGLPKGTIPQGDGTFKLPDGTIVRPKK